MSDRIILEPTAEHPITIEPIKGRVFAAHGWTTRTVDAREEALRLGWAAVPPIAANGFVTATKP